MAEATLEAVADHGLIRSDTIAGSYGEAASVLHRLRRPAFDHDDVVRQLEVEGLRKFEDAWTEVLESVVDQLSHAAHGVPARAGRL